MSLVLFIVVCVVVIATVMQFVRAGTILDRWASRRGYQILERDRRFLREGPFILNTSKGQLVYRVTVRDREGKVRKGYVRCGGALLGMLSDKVEVRWDDQPRDFFDYPADFPGGR